REHRLRDASTERVQTGHGKVFPHAIRRPFCLQPLVGRQTPQSRFNLRGKIQRDVFLLKVAGNPDETSADRLRHYTAAGTAARTGLRSTPMRSTSTSTVSPSFSHSCGLRDMP